MILVQIPNIVVEEKDRPMNIRIDEKGRTIDVVTGEVVELPSRLPTLKANRRGVSKREIVKSENPKAQKESFMEYPGMDTSAAHFDARIG